MKRLLISFLLVLFMSVCIHAQDEMKSAGNSAKRSSKNIGKATEKALKKGERDVRRTGKKVKKDINQERFKTTFETITKDIESGCKKTRDAARKYWENFLKAIKIKE